MKISILSTTTYETPAKFYGGEVVIYDLAMGLYNLGNEVILYAVKNDDIEYPFKVNKLKNTYGQLGYQEESAAWTYYKDDILSSDVVLDMSHLKRVGSMIHDLKIKEEVVTYLIGNCWMNQAVPFNIVVNSAKQLDMGIKGDTGFEGTPAEKSYPRIGHIPKTSKYAHLGVNTDFYEFKENKEDYFLWLARFHPMKGPEVAIQLAKETGINLIMAGDSLSHPEHYRHWQYCMEQIKGWNNIKYVELPRDNTHQIAKMKLMQNAKCSLFPVQFHESFGLTVTEALSCGTPVIASNMGSMPEIIKHGETGFIARDYQQFKTYINSIDVINPKDCRKDVEKRFSREAMAKRYEKILKECANGESW